MKNQIKNITDLFNSSPSFLKGVSRLANLGHSSDDYNYSEDPDKDAIAKDWQNVGRDMQTAIQGYAKENQKATN